MNKKQHECPACAAELMRVSTRSGKKFWICSKGCGQLPLHADQDGNPT